MCYAFSMKIFCLALNYTEHAEEVGFAIPEKPAIFLKPSTALLAPGRPFEYPSFTQKAQYETEIVIRMDKQGKNIPVAEAKDYYSQITVGIDFTARDVQRGLVKSGMPWEIAKAFDGSAFIGEFIPKPENTSDIDFKLMRSGQVIQQGNTGNLTLVFDEMVSYISEYFTIEPGDLVYTGSPYGTGDVAKGDVLEGFIGDQKLFDCNVV